MGWRMYFLKSTDTDKESVFEVSRYSDLYSYLEQHLSRGSYDQDPKKISESELLLAERDITEDIENAKFRLVVGMAQGKDAVEIQGDFDYYEELVGARAELNVLQRVFSNLSGELYCWIG